MQRLSLLLLALIAAFTLRALSAAASDASDSDAIRAVLAAQTAAWNRGDIDGFMNGYARSDDTEFISGETLTRGWQTVRNRYQKKYDTREKMGILTFSEIVITPLGADAALVLGRWSLARSGDTPHGRFTLIFRRSRPTVAAGASPAPAAWRIVHDHTS